jgi:hypothetical protein
MATAAIIPVLPTTTGAGVRPSPAEAPPRRLPRAGTGPGGVGTDGSAAPASSPADSAPGVAGRRGDADFWAFILVNATLFIRPGEIVTILYGMPIYELANVLCLALCLPEVVRQFRANTLAIRPITLCVLGLMVAVVLSRAVHGDVYNARVLGFAFFKVVVYYLMLMATVTSADRLRRFLLWIARFAFVLTVLALLQYHGVIDIEALTPAYEYQDDVDPVTGEQVLLVRLCSAGIFGNPNDLSRILVIGTAVAWWCITEPALGNARYLWVAPLGMFGYALHLTHSRGGFLSLLSCIAVLFRARFGWLKTVALSAVVIPGILLVFGGRQTQMDTESGTGQQRIQIWSEGFRMFRESPWFGIGIDKYGEELYYNAHNSFVQCFTELGLFGGTLFVGAFYIALSQTQRLGAHPELMQDPLLRRLRPYLMGIVAGYVVGMLTSTRSYNLPTYVVLGLAAAYLRLSGAGTRLRDMRLNVRLVRNITLVSALFFTALYVYVRYAVHWQGTE